MKFVKKMLVAIFLVLIGVFLRVWKIGYYVSGFLEVAAWIIFGVAILIAIDAVVEDYIRDDKEKK
mgnify:FL=1